MGSSNYKWLGQPSGACIVLWYSVSNACTLDSVADDLIVSNDLIVPNSQADNLIVSNDLVVSNRAAGGRRMRGRKHI